MSGARVLLTGAFGNVGCNTIGQLLAQGHEVHALDIRSDKSRKAQARLARRHRFTTHWVDLRDVDAVLRVMRRARPEVIVHVPAVIAPMAYVHPALARAVNVDGTRHLLSAAKQLVDPPRFVFTSSYSVHGPRNPHRNLPPLTGDSPVDPRDNYGRHKVIGEQDVAASGLPFVILRLPCVLATDPDWGSHPVFIKFFTLLDPDRREHVLDSRDAALALANAVEADVTGMTLNLGGPEIDCRVTGRQNHVNLIRARGLRPFPLTWFRRCDPEADDAWYYEDFVDTARSEALLRYQQHTFAEHVDFMRHQLGLKIHLYRLSAPLAERYILSKSPYYGTPPALDSQSTWQAACRAFGLDPTVK